jgi:LuxR family maltose regulon positive regulatory protein
MSGLTFATPPRHGVPVVTRPDRTLPRTRLLERIRSDPAPVVVVEGPAGSGKSTLITQLALADPRPCAWVTIEDRHSDPVLLVQALGRALGEVHPTRPLAGRLAGTDAMRGLARLIRALDQQPDPTLLVVDDIHRLTDPQAVDLLVALADHLPASGRLALATRTTAGLPMTRWALIGRALHIGRTALDLDADECAALLRRFGVDDVTLATDIHQRTEGWVAGAHLMALASLEDGRPVSTDAGVRLAEDHVRIELLDRLDHASRTLLTRTSLLDVITGPLAEAVSDEPGAAQLLAGIADHGVLVTALDPAGSFRIHGLLRDVLSQELARDPSVDLDVRLRAAAWYEAAGMPDEAIEHSLGAGDLERAARLLLEHAQPLFREGRVASLVRWIDAFDDADLRTRGELGALAAYIHALEGDAPAAARWAALPRPAPDAPSADSDGPGLALVSSALCERGPEAMLGDALQALESHDDRWRWRTSALYFAGMAEAMLGRRDGATGRFLAMETVPGVGAALVRLSGRAERALADADERRWAAAQAILDLDRSAVLSDPESGRVAGLTWLVADARLAIHRGDPAAALDRIQRVQLGRVRLSWGLPWLAVHALTELARVQLLIGDHRGARASLSQARDTVAMRPDLGRFIDELERVSQQALAAPRGDDSWSTLTRAELRLLPFLQTYLTIKEIGERLGVSPNTAKTQALSIYGKLGASTRSEAVEAAVERGLLEDLFAGRS